MSGQILFISFLSVFPPLPPLNSNLPEFIYDENGRITGYKSKDGADTVHPFINGYISKFGTHIITSGINKIELNFQPDIIAILIGTMNLSLFYMNGTTYYSGGTFDFITSVNDGFTFDEARFNVDKDAGREMWYIASISQEE